MLCFFFLSSACSGTIKPVGSLLKCTFPSVWDTHCHTCIYTHTHTHSEVRCCVWIWGQVEVPPSHLKVIKSPLLIFWWTLRTTPVWFVCVSNWPFPTHTHTHTHTLCTQLGNKLYHNPTQTRHHSDSILARHYTQTHTPHDDITAKHTLPPCTHARTHTCTSKWAAATHLHYRLAFSSAISTFSGWMRTQEKCISEPTVHTHTHTLWILFHRGLKAIKERQRSRCIHSEDKARAEKQRGFELWNVSSL